MIDVLTIKLGQNRIKEVKWKTKLKPSLFGLTRTHFLGWFSCMLVTGRRCKGFWPELRTRHAQKSPGTDSRVIGAAHCRIFASVWKESVGSYKFVNGCIGIHMFSYRIQADSYRTHKYFYETQKISDWIPRASENPLWERFSPQQLIFCPKSTGA